MRKPISKINDALEHLNSMASATRKELFDRAAADRTRIFAAHFAYPALGYMRRNDTGYEFSHDRWVWI
jgi:hypothetical protein